MLTAPTVGDTISPHINEVMRMNQKQRILVSDAPVQTVAGREYKGRPPVLQAKYDANGFVEGYVKLARGVPFVRTGGGV